MAQNNFSIRKESDNIDLSLNNIKALYTVSEKYKKRQKSSTGRILPFEYIDKSIYKEKANCTCFITSEFRVHHWLLALAKVLWVNLSDLYDIIWRDRKDEKNDIINQTEFIVYEKAAENEDEFRFKVIVYLTIGKIMIQGREWEQFCDHYFNKCLSILNELSDEAQIKPTNLREISETIDTACAEGSTNDKSDETFLKEILNDNIISENVNEPLNDLTKTLNEHATIQIVTPPDINNHSRSVIPNQVSDTSKVIEDVLKNLLTPLKNSMSVIEDAIVEVKTTVSKLLMSNQTMEQHNISLLKDLKTLGKQSPSTPLNDRNNDVFESLIKEKDKEITKLTKSIDDMSKTHEAERKNLNSDFKSKETRLKERINDINQQNNHLAGENERLHAILKEKEESEKRELSEKEKVIKDLQDRIQNYLYDVNGEPWCKKAGKTLSDEFITGESKIDSDKIHGKEKQEIENVDHDKGKSENQKGCSATMNTSSVHDILFLHDSICHDIEIRRLLAGSDKKGEKVTTYTIESARATLSKTIHINTLILHVGINNLKSQPAEEVFAEFKELISEASQKSDRIVISCPTPSRIRYLNNRVQHLNSLIKSNFERKENISLCYNGNFSVNGEIIEELFFNSTKLSREHGIRLLAGNLRRSLFPELRHRQTDNAYYRDRVEYNEQSTDYMYIPSYRDERQHQYEGNTGRRYYSGYSPSKSDKHLDHPSQSEGNYRQRQINYQSRERNMCETDKLANSIAAAIKEALCS